MASAVILDFDGSVKPLDGTRIIPLQEQQEAIRFGCRLSELRALAPLLHEALRSRPDVVFLGSGDFHHLTYPLIANRVDAVARPIQVVVFDNHPDNMRYPFGIHCGSWVSHVSRLPLVARVHVVGITSSDVEGAHAWENRLLPLRRGRVVYWCVRRNLRVLRLLGARQSRSFASMEELLPALQVALARTAEPVYLSIDKDVLSSEVVQTNWDQGVMSLSELEQAVAMLRTRLIGADVVGDVSHYKYRSRLKRWLSALDGQPAIPPESLEAWQSAHQRLNARLLALLSSTP